MSALDKLQGARTYFTITVAFLSAGGGSASGPCTFITDDANAAEELLESLRRDERARIIEWAEVHR